MLGQGEGHISAAQLGAKVVQLTFSELMVAIPVHTTASSSRAMTGTPPLDMAMREDTHTYITCT